MNYIASIGSYAIMVREVFKKPTKWPVMKSLILKEIDELIYGSMGIIIFISFFIGGVVAIQTALNLTNPLIPKNLIGFAGIEKEVVLNAADNMIEIWDKSRYEENINGMTDEDYDAFSEEIFNEGGSPLS